jgi:hypothetical protein
MLDWSPFSGEAEMPEQDNNSWVIVGAWGKTRVVLGLALLAGISYQNGVAHARSERSKEEFSALRTQYDRVLTMYSESKAQCAETLTEYAALKSQYDRIEVEKTKSAINKPKIQP